MTQAAHGGHAEVEGGRLAQANAADAGVKQYGDLMVEDHTKANQELAEAANALGLTVPTGTDAQHRQMLDRLAPMKGADFDRAYIADMISGHQKMAELLESMSQEASNAQLKDWARRTLPTVQAHLRQAEQLQTSMR